MMTLEKMIEAYYPKLWDKGHIIQLVQKGKITTEKYKEVVGEEYTGTVDSKTPEEKIQTLSDTVSSNQLQNDTAIAELSMLISTMITPTT